MPDDSSPLRHRLLARIRRRYEIVTQEVQFGALRFPFSRIANPDRVLDEVAAEADLRDRLQGTRAPGDELHLPYWAELWESARGIGEFLLREQLHVGRALPAIAPIGGQCPPYVGISVLDLGCGMGMAGTVAAGLGASVVFADLEAPALLFARLNSLPWRDHVRTRRLNWQRDRLNEKFDLILGADILYERAQWPWLNTFWRTHLTPNGRVVLGEPGRQTGDMFIEWITVQGWRLQTSEVPVAGRPRPIRIFIIS